MQYPLPHPIAAVFAKVLFLTRGFFGTHSHVYIYIITDKRKSSNLIDADIIVGIEKRHKEDMESRKQLMEKLDKLLDKLC